jgi:hypothetical protein
VLFWRHLNEFFIEPATFSRYGAMPLSLRNL